MASPIWWWQIGARIALAWPAQWECCWARATEPFRPAVAYDSGGLYADSVAVADVNGDGNADIVVGTCGFPKVINCVASGGKAGVLLGNGDGTFQPAVSYTLGGSGATSVAVADVNGDGKPDLLVATGSAVGVLLGNGDGTFQTVTKYSSGGLTALSVAVADVNGDAKPDLVVANWCTDSSCTASSVGVLLGNGDGTFQTAVTYDSGGIFTNSVVIGDVNGDGKLDLVVVNGSTTGTDAGNVGVLVGQRRRNLPASRSLPSGPSGRIRCRLGRVVGRKRRWQT